jgi:hypothetical protein
VGEFNFAFTSEEKNYALIVEEVPYAPMNYDEVDV